MVVCANLPYYITSPVIMKLLEDGLPISFITVMVQKEAAQRICAPVGSRMCGALTVAVNYYSKPSALFNVSAGSFMPAPRVDSSVIRLKVESPEFAAKDKETFFRVVKSAFGQRRKTLLNSLSAGLCIDKHAVGKILESSGVPSNYRAEQLTMEQFCRVSDNYYNLREEK